MPNPDPFEPAPHAQAAAALNTRWTRWTLGLGLLFAAWSGCYRIRTFDTMFHLATGNYILAHRVVPASDLFSYTFPDAVWRNHSWGFQVLLAPLYTAGGFAAVSAYQGLVSLALAGCGFLALREQPRLWAAASLLMAAATVAFREVLEARPHALGFLCLSATVLLTLHLRRRPRWVTVAGLVGIYGIWACVHGSHLLAFALLALGLITDARREPRRGLPWIVALSCSLVLGLWLAPAAFHQGTEHLGSEFLETSITEWYPVSLRDLVTFWPGRVFLLCWLLALQGAVVARVRPDDDAARLPAGAYPLVLFGLFALLALTSRRMLGLFLFGAAPIWLPYAAYAWTRAWQAVDAHRTARLSAGALAGACGWLVLTVSLCLPDGRFATGLGLASNRFPVRAVDAVRAAGRIKRIYNAYNFGGYLMLRGVPRGGVFVDGRGITLYPADFLQATEHAYRNPNVFDQLAQRFAVDGVLMPVQSARTQLLRQHLARAPRWRLTYQDAIAEVYEPAAVTR